MKILENLLYDKQLQKKFLHWFDLVFSIPIIILIFTPETKRNKKRERKQQKRNKNYIYIYLKQVQRDIEPMMEIARRFVIQPTIEYPSFLEARN